MILFALLFSSFTHNAHAQSIQDALNAANADYAAADKAFKDQVNNSSQYVPCDAERSNFVRKYSSWFQQNATLIYERYNSLDELFKYANSKIDALRAMSFHPIVEQGQKEDPTVTFQTVLNYIGDMHIRKQASLKANQLAVFQHQTTQPEYSPFNLTLVQVIDSLKGMSEQMNTSLKDRGVKFEIDFKDTKDGYTLALNVTIHNSPSKIALDLLTAGTHIEFSEENRWKLIGAGKIGEFSVDSRLRVEEMIKVSGVQNCFPWYDTTPIGQPYVAHANLLPASSYLTLQKLTQGVVKCDSTNATFEFLNGTVTGWNKPKRKDPSIFDTYTAVFNRESRNLHLTTKRAYYYNVTLAVNEKGEIVSSNYGNLTCTFNP